MSNGIIKYLEICYDDLEIKDGDKHVTCPYFKLGIAIILFIATYLNYSKRKVHHLIINLAYGIKIIHAININFWFWELIEEFMAASNGEGGNHMLLTLKMLCGFSCYRFYGNFHC